MENAWPNYKQSLRQHRYEVKKANRLSFLGTVLPQALEAKFHCLI